MKTTTTPPPAGLFRRLGALFYDFLIIMAILMIAGGIIVAILEALLATSLVGYGNYIDASNLLSEHPIISPIYQLYLFSVVVYFFVYFWTKAGQTLGMRAWKLRIQNEDGTLITTTQALIRLATSAFGLGNLLVPLDPQKRAFQDMWAKTQVVVLPKAN
ncbi:RDD family protein [Vibrio sp.]|nr:RDD family protein [Vibrio sp.]